MVQRARTMVTTAGSLFAASMLRDMERGARTEVEHVLGDLLRRGGDALGAPSVLRIAHGHVATYEAQRARMAAG
jgi:2-dehydropantoate 2-reductase